MSASKMDTFFQSVVKHSPEIMTGCGVAGSVTALILAVAATPKAMEAIKKKKEELEVQKLKFIELLKSTWYYYIPATLTEILAILCIIGANSVNVRRNAALAAAYTLSETTLRDYREKVVEAIGEKKEQDIKDTIAKEKIERTPVSNSEVILTGMGETLCFDAISGRYFKSNIEDIRKAANKLNREMRDVMYITLNEFYAEIGLEQVKLGDELGWNIDRGYIDIDFSAQLAENEQPCLVLDYVIVPMYDYRI